MTDREKAIVMAHTGICMLVGDKFHIFHKYVEDIMGRPIMTHDIGWLENEIKEKSKSDFKALCADESGKVNVFDKIRAEISDFEEEVFNRPNTDYSDYAAVRHCLEIIDKYKKDL